MSGNTSEIKGSGKGRGIFVPAVSAAAASVLLCFFLLCFSVFAVCYLNPGYFEREYEKYDVLSSLPEMTMSEEDGLMAVTDHMMEYLLKGDEPEDLQIEVQMGGELRGFFSEREIAHMWDVRRLFKYGIMLSIGAVIAAALMLVFSRFALCGGDKVRFLAGTGRGLAAGTSAAILAAGALVVYMANNFNTAFVTFHHIFFDNDLWILDGSKDMLINIVPEGFFCDTAFRIAVLFLIFASLMIAAGAAMIRKSARSMSH